MKSRRRLILFLKEVWHTLQIAGYQFFEDEVMTRAAALAFYAALSLAPLMLLFVATTGQVVDHQMQEAMIVELRDTVGPQGAQAIDVVLRNTRLRRDAGMFSFTVSLVTLVIGATAVFVQLQWTMNTIWGVEIRTSELIWVWFKKRLFSLLMMGVLAFLLLASLIATAVISGVYPDAQPGWRYIDWGLSLLIFTFLFAGMFKMLPDVRIEWKPVWVGAVTTAVLFAVGKWAIGLYLGTSTFTSAYGAAGSLIALLLWVYYSSIIFFFGAELTEVYAKRAGARVKPDDFAKRTPLPHHGEPATGP